MRITHPDDAMGSRILLGLPSVIAHPIDSWSPLNPKAFSKQNQMREYHWPDVLRREDDTFSGDRSAYSCPACGDCFSSLISLKNHVSYASQIDKSSGFDEKTDGECCHSRISLNELEETRVSISQVLEHVMTTRTEIICMIEGTDLSTSTAVQARQSYTGDNIDHQLGFKKCVFCQERDSDSFVRIDYGRFHELDFGSTETITEVN
jgi:hypothetical protein